ncbi:MAG: hypothetical protein ACXABO_16830 [Promethearchaeota archaeon]|jgi:hypothetical protein
MSKTVSYYDWEQSFRKPSELEKKPYEKKKVNSLGISEVYFKDFMKKWKNKNIS